MKGHVSVWVLEGRLFINAVAANGQSGGVECAWVSGN